MINVLFSNPFVFVIGMTGLVLAITIHEFAHAYTADKLGDPTPGLQGRVTLNPLAHLDPIGSLMILFIGFGWGKPVSFDPFNLQNPRRDTAVISLAGPASNIIMAILLAISARFIPSPYSLVIPPLVYINLMLAFFNLIPVHPLDGFKIVSGFLPEKKSHAWDKTQKYSIILLLLLLLPLTSNGSFVHTILTPILDFVLRLLLG